VKYGFVAKHRGIWPAAWICEMLDVSRSGFYEWFERPASARSQANVEMTRQIRTSFIDSDRDLLREIRTTGYLRMAPWWVDS
jgi:putative transposase